MTDNKFSLPKDVIGGKKRNYKGESNKTQTLHSKCQKQATQIKLTPISIYNEEG